MTQLFGKVIYVGQTTGGTAAAKLSLYGGKNQDGSYKRGIVASLVGKPLADLVVGQKVQVLTNFLTDNAYDVKDSDDKPAGKAVGLSGVARKVTKMDDDAKGNAIELYGNLVADQDGKKFAVIVNGEADTPDDGKTRRYDVYSHANVEGLKKGDFVKIGGSINGSAGEKFNFLNVDAFSITKIDKKEKTEQPETPPAEAKSAPAANDVKAPAKKSKKAA